MHGNDEIKYNKFGTISNIPSSFNNLCDLKSSVFNNEFKTLDYTLREKSEGIMWKIFYINWGIYDGVV